MNPRIPDVLAVAGTLKRVQLLAGAYLDDLTANINKLLTDASEQALRWFVR
jgi:hypothetical protein